MIWCLCYLGVRIKRGLRENVRDTCFIDITTKADSLRENVVWFLNCKAAFTRQTKSWQTHVGKLKLVCVNGTNTLANCWRQNRTSLYSCQLFRVGKLVFDVWTIGKRVSVTVNQSKHALYSRDLRDTSQNGGRMWRPWVNFLIYRGSSKSFNAAFISVCLVMKFY